MRAGSIFFAAAVVACVTACAGAQAGGLGSSEPMLGDDWFAHRAAELAIDVGRAKERDAAIAETAPPDSYEDPRLEAPAAALWGSLCAKCHGMDGDPPDNADFDPPPRDWDGFGAAMGFFFGGDKMRAGVYRRIADGKLPGMPAWKESLSREQIWALVRHIESF